MYRAMASLSAPFDGCDQGQQSSQIWMTSVVIAVDPTLRRHLCGHSDRNPKKVLPSAEKGAVSRLRVRAPSHDAAVYRLPRDF
jgi:hypothetical protein